jgi:hypothetical protein
MARGWKELDRILRGEATRLSSLRQGTVEVPVGGLTVVLVGLAMLHGVFMGSFGIFQGNRAAWLQVLSSMVKVPALFVLTLAVTFPSLYVFNALVGSRLSLGSLLRLLVAALGVTVAVLTSLGPIVAFFAASTTSYAFMKLLNVLAFTVAGFLGTAFLLQSLHRLSLIVPEPPPKPQAEGETREPESEERPVELEFVAEQGPPGAPPALRRQPGALEPVDERVLSRHVKLVFRCWILLFGLVGAQMGWVLRPFIGNPHLPFALFRARESNIFLAILQALGDLLRG